MRMAPLAEVTRGGLVESVHAGAVAVVDRDGQVLYAAGDPRQPIFTRSTLKPFQTVPLVASGGIERFGFTLQQTALLCASHSGTAQHVAAVAAMLEAIGCNEADLQCGCHAPIAADAPPGPYNQLHNNCSGKHAGFLAYCVMHGHPIGSYLDVAHPLQQAVRDSVAHYCGVAPDALAVGIDGCSAPNYAMPLVNLARGYARLASATGDDQSDKVAHMLYRAMTDHPEMVSGDGRFDLAVTQAGNGDWVAKGGAEGVQAIGIRSLGIGIAIKVADGNARGLHPAALAVLAHLGVLDAARAQVLSCWMRPDVTNVKGLKTGEIRAVVSLQKG